MNPGAAGVFESIELRGSAPFAPTRHLERLRAGATAVGLAVPDEEEIRAAITAVATAWGPEPGRLRVTLAPDLMVTAAPMRVLTEPTDVVVAPFVLDERGALVGVKTTSYAAHVAALHHAQEAGGGEALLANTAGVLCEGSGSNVFVGLDGHLVTPPLSSGCLPGVTRALLLEALDATGRPAIEADVPLEQLGEVAEAFLVSTGRHVQPISRIDQRVLAGCPGPLTSHAASTWRDTYAERLDP